MLGGELLEALDSERARKLAQREDLKERVLRCRRNNPEMTVTELRRRFGISLTLIKTFIAESEK